MSRDDTYARAVASVEEQAVDAFKTHVLTETRPWVWKVARKGDWTYGFFVVIAPGALMVYGDLGEATFRMNAGTDDEVLEWTKMAARDRFYLLSKISNREAFKRFYPGDAVAYAETLMKERPDTRHPEDRTREFSIDVASIDRDGELHSEAFYTLAQEFGQYDMPGCIDWSAGAIWMAKALEKFVELKGE